MKNSAEAKWHTSSISVEGIGIFLKTRFQEVHSDFEHDFHYFLKPAASDLTVVVCPKSIGQEKWKPLLKTKRSTLFRAPKGERRVCFFGKAWVRYAFHSGYCFVSSQDPASAYEALYLTVLSYTGERLDLRGQHRLHGLGVERHGKGGVVLAPSGGGKSTLGLELLKDPAIRILSDDTPIVQKRSTMQAFPQRIAIKEKPDIEEKYLRTFKRFAHGEKHVVGAEYLSGRISPKASIDWLCLLEKTKNLDPRLELLSRHRLFWPLMKWLVVGYETPQIWELYLRLEFRDCVGKLRIAFSRFHVALKILTSAKGFRFSLSEDRALSGVHFRRFLAGDLV